MKIGSNILLIALVYGLWGGLLAPLELRAVSSLSEEEPKSQNPLPSHAINFRDVPITEFIRFVSKVASVNFIFNSEELTFNISFSTGKSVSSEEIVKALTRILRVHGWETVEEEGYLVIQKIELAPEEPFGGREFAPSRKKAAVEEIKGGPPASLEPPPFATQEEPPQFLVYKLQYHSGETIEASLRKIAADLATKRETSPKYLSVLQSVQWVQATNSIVCSGDSESLSSVRKLMESLDAPLKQVFIEVLVIETDIRHTADFGLQWAAGGKYHDALGFGLGNFAPGGQSSFADAFRGIDATHSPAGPSQIPFGRGFDMGVIGDLIMHKGKAFFSLGSLVSALQSDGDTSIILNQKIITQDNKNSTIFVGDNIPFTGSVVQTTGASQQTTANIEYRDIGVSLSITPKLGEGDIITLDLNEEITEALPNYRASSSQVGGIQTTKTNMMTHVHVPDQHFLVLSGMVRNSQNRHKVGLPCLGGLPFLGAAFSQNQHRDEKRSIIVFVRPRIVHSMEDYQKLTQAQEVQPVPPSAH